MYHVVYKVNSMVHCMYKAKSLITHQIIRR
nr:MAG TPA: hypothetical protein [Caudoviricetes sp.]DAS09105.1 MAG TPA: hypothetical protein [Caudoviricetes sp.]DAX60081.1 MAG TPA: hypothetical protein [Caudoviricetes sp.]DAY02677.1 MAG TPA: hypothetical protein [Caudoviricetes sp.]